MQIQAFYACQLDRVKASTVIKYHGVIHRALKYAVQVGLIDSNPASKVDKPRVERYEASYYSSEEVNLLFKVAKDSRLEIPILFGAFYGLRRSEIIGLRWSSFNFDSNSFIINHTVTSFTLDNKYRTHASNSTKTRSSTRTLPLVPEFKERLLKIKERQEFYKDLCGNSYNQNYLDYVCVNEIGERLRPGYITYAFPRLLEKNGLRRIRFHDLRHSCASLLLANGVPMKQIQEWLGHSDYATTDNIYAHLDYKTKLVSAQAMVEGLSFGREIKSYQQAKQCGILS